MTRHFIVIQNEAMSALWSAKVRLFHTRSRRVPSYKKYASGRISFKCNGWRQKNP